MINKKEEFNSKTYKIYSTNKNQTVVEDIALELKKKNLCKIIQVIEKGKLFYCLYVRKR